MLNIFLLNQLDTCCTCLMGLKVSIDKNLKERGGGGGVENFILHHYRLIRVLLGYILK